MVPDPKLVSTDVPTLNPPLRGEFKATRFAGGRLLRTNMSGSQISRDPGYGSILKGRTIPKHVAIWGSTGSIGRQTLDVISRVPDLFEVDVLTTHRNVDLLMEQIRRFRPKRIVVTGEVPLDAIRSICRELKVEVLYGKRGLLEAASDDAIDLAVNALVGSVGLEATLRALGASVSIALANKEVLVMAGQLVMDEACRQGLDILPVDSEHSAIFQCLRGEDTSTIRRLILTASGGPFLSKPASELSCVTINEALAHPNWSMGKKVTIDSATLMNKGFEVIEARWLFDVRPDQIDVVIHPQSVIHSMVEFVDGSLKAQLGTPDMRVPILYALSYPQRQACDVQRTDVHQFGSLTFSPPDVGRFPALGLAYQSLEAGGTAPAVLNGADEAAVAYFLSGRIPFTQIAAAIDDVLQRHDVMQNPDLETILETDRWAKQTVNAFISSHE